MHVAGVTLQEWKVATNTQRYMHVHVSGGHFTGMEGSYDTQGYMHMHVAEVTLQEWKVVTTHRGSCMCM